MSMLDIHDDALKSPNVVYHQFLLLFRSQEKAVYGIVEGKDDPILYRGFIDLFLPDDWNVELIAAGSKSNVLASMSVFDWRRFSQKRVCFFIDRDLQDFATSPPVVAPNLYITDGYSIENDCITFACFRRLLEEVFNLGSLKMDEVAEVRHRFDKGFALFCETLKPVMAQIIMWRREGKRCSLDNIQVREWFVFRDGEISVKPDYSTDMSRVEHSAGCVQLDVGSEELREQIEKEILAAGVGKVVRGKYVLWFMVQFALHLHSVVHLVLGRFSAPPKVRISVGHKNASIVVAPRMRCPESLKTFIRDTYLAFVDDGEPKQTDAVVHG